MMKGAYFAFVLIRTLCLFLPISIGIPFSLSAQYNKKNNFSKSTVKKEQASEISPLSVGDQVPDIEISNILNYPSGKARMSDFKDKLLIVDFWGTTCSSCISALPKFDSLQQVYKSKIQVLTVTNYDSKERVVKTLQRYKRTQNLTLPIVLNDVNLKTLFPHELVSHVVWIDKSGIVKAVTGSEYVTGKNIQSVLAGAELNWPVKNDVFDFDYQKPFLDFSQSNLTKPKFIYSSALTDHIEGIDATDKLLVDSNAGTVTRNHFNHTLIQLCDGSLNGSGTGYIHPKDLVLEVKDRTRYIRDENSQYYAEWAMKNTFSYSITLPLSLSKEQTKEIIKTDLSHWLNVLGIYVKKEKRKMQCLALIRNDKNDDLLKSKSAKYEWQLDNPGKLKSLHNGTIEDLIWYINNKTSIPWIFDETGISKDFRIDIDLKSESFQSVANLKKELERYGLSLTEIEREREMYVITEK